MLLLLFLVGVLLLFVSVKPNKSRSINADADLHSIHDFFKTTNKPKMNGEKNVISAIRYLNQITKQVSAELTNEGQLMRLDTLILALESYANDDRIISLVLTPMSLIANKESIQSILLQSGRLELIVKIVSNSLTRAKR